MRKGFTLVEIMVVVAIVAVLAAIAIPNLLRARATANDSAAQANLRTISAAYETYASSHSGSYNETTANLADSSQHNPVYLNENYADGANRHGYSYSCTPADASYTCTATPATCNVSGTKVFTIIDGGRLTSADCT